MHHSKLSDQLTELKDRGNLTIQDIAQMSDVPEGTVKKIFSGATENPSFQAVCKIVAVLGGSVDELVGIKPVSKADTVYISQELIDSYKRHINDKARWMRVFFKALCVVVGFIMVVLLFDLFNGGIGYIRY